MTTVHELRRSSGLTEAGPADRSGASATTISRYDNESRPTVARQTGSGHGLHSRFAIVSMTSFGAMCARYRSVVASEAWPS